jgi:hypothetical protein
MVSHLRRAANGNDVTVRCARDDDELLSSRAEQARRIDNRPPRHVMKRARAVDDDRRLDN